jgi:hypothetical protein
MQELQSTAALFRSHQSYAALRAYAENIRTLVESGRFAVLS